MKETSIIPEKVSCTAIVCAYNEEKTLAGVLNTLLQSRQIDEVVVVNDGSTDRTHAVVSDFDGHRKVRSISFHDNLGKGYAMAEGVINARGKIIVFIDADLLDLSTAHIDQILTPLLNEEVEMAIGYPSRVLFKKEIVNLLRPLSGERAVFREDILPLVDQIRDSRFGVETLINIYYRKEKKRVCYIPLYGLFHPIKLEKTGPMEAFGMYSREAFQITQAVARHHPMVIAALMPNIRGDRQFWEDVGNRLSGDLIDSRLWRACLDPRRTIIKWREPLQRRIAIARRKGKECGQHANPDSV